MSSVADNRMRWSREPGRYEVWFLTASHRASRSGFWIRHTLSAPTQDRGLPPYCQLWFACFDGGDPGRSFAVNRKLPIDSLHAEPDPLVIGVGDAELRHGALHGAIEGHGHAAEWDLGFEPEDRTVLLFPDWAYASERVSTKFLSPHFSVPLRGRIKADGREYVFDGDRATQCHIWGNKHAHAWGWGHVCGFAEDGETALDVLSVRLKKGPIVLPRLTLATLRHRGTVTRFSQPLSLMAGQGEWGTGFFRFAAATPTLRVRGEFTASPDDMVVAEYTDPDGEAAFCHNTEVASLTMTIESRTWLSGWRDEARLTAPRSAHFEHAARTPDASIRRRHRTA
ncbi:MAG: hypothetical protein HY906_14640 [Deltaproteobacteria bacterium]|nr:hypothetical protein [Deltaproteobacteria bacterium]